MDSAVNGFLYVNSGDDVAAVSNQLSVSFPSWTDTQGNCMKVTLSAGSIKAAGMAAGIVPDKTKKPTTLKDPSDIAASTHGVKNLKPPKANTATKSVNAPSGPRVRR